MRRLQKEILKKEREYNLWLKVFKVAFEELGGPGSVKFKKVFDEAIKQKKELDRLKVIQETSHSNISDLRTNGLHKFRIKQNQ